MAADGAESRIVTAITVTPGDEPEHRKLPVLVGKHTFNLRRRPGEVVADRGYGKKDVYVFLKSQGMTPMIPRHTTHKKKRAGKHELGFTYDEKEDVYIRPRGKKLYRMKTEKDQIKYLAHRYACSGCDLSKDCGGAKRCSITRPPDVVEEAMQNLKTNRGREALRLRKCWVETINAALKCSHSMQRARYRGNSAVTIQAILSACAHNILKLVRGYQRRIRGPARTMPRAALKAA